MKYQSGYFVLDANHGSWPVSGFCQAISTKIIQTNSYQVAAQLLNYQGWNGANSGHLGLIYNVANSGNYDFVYFRYVSMCLFGVFLCFETIPGKKFIVTVPSRKSIFQNYFYSLIIHSKSSHFRMYLPPFETELFLPLPIFVASKTCWLAKIRSLMLKFTWAKIWSGDVILS